MNKEIRKHPLKKEHFEILLEDIQDKFQFLVDGHITLNEKVDLLGNEIKATRDELHATRDELIFLMRTSIDKSEERLTKKIEDCDKTVMNYTDQKTREVMAYTDQKTREVMAYTDRKVQEVVANTDQKINLVIDHTDRKIEEVKDILKDQSGKLDTHERRITQLEQKNRT